MHKVMCNYKNIIISGTNFWNPGDDFVRDGVIKLLHQLFPDYKLSFLFYNFNQDFLPASKFDGIHNMLSPGDLDKISQDIDAVVIAGLSAGLEIKDLYNWIIKNNLQNRVYLIGAGYENDYVAQYILQEPEKTIFQNAKIITGRTRKVPSLIHELHLPYHHINCPALLSVENVKKIEDSKTIRKIGFSIQIPHEMGIINQATGSSMFKLALEILLELSNDYEVEVVAHHKSEYFYFLNLFREKNIPIKVYFSSFYQYLHEIYPDFDLVVTTRLHSGLFANGFGIPSLIINETDRHTHCLEGFPHSVWINSKENFYKVFDEYRQKSLSVIADEMQLFKRNLIGKYLEVLYKPFGINANTVNLIYNNPQLKSDTALPIHFFTIVLNGKPFIEYHINVLKNLPFKWHWHIVEGVAELKHDTAWSVVNGGRIDDEIHENGLSNDGTTAYLNQLEKLFPGNITVYRKTINSFWDGKLEMVNQPLENINEECLLWQIDADELWTLEQIKEARNMFLQEPDKTAAYFYCNYFVGENRVIITEDTYGNNKDYEWLRLWRFQPGDKWLSHEPPKLSRKVADEIWIDLGKVNIFTHNDTKTHNLVFQHYAYVTESQLRFKEIYYGYSSAVEKWKKLNNGVELPARLKDFFDWVSNPAIVESVDKIKITQLALRKNDKWFFNYEKENIYKETKLFWNAYDFSVEAEDHINNEELVQGRKKLMIALDIDNNNVDALNNLAVIETMQENYFEAVTLLKKVISIDPQNDVALDNLAIIRGLIKQNEFSDETYVDDRGKLIQPIDLNGFKFQLNFDLNDGCNLNCKMCGNVPNRNYKNQHVMSEDVFSKNLLPAFRHANDFQFGCFFEPLMVPYFEKAVWEIKKYLPENVKGTIISNGTLLKDSKISSIVDSDIFKTIRFSIDSVDEQNFQKIRVGAKLKQVISNIEKLVGYKTKQNSRSKVEVNFTIMRENILELPQLVLLAKEIGIDSISTHKLTPDDVAFVDSDYYNILTENIALAADLAKNNNIHFIGQKYRVKDEYDGIINKVINKECGYHLRNYLLLSIDSKGNVNHPCKLFTGAVGNLVQNNFDQILNSENFKILFNSIKNPSPELCTGCGMFV